MPDPSSLFTGLGADQDDLLQQELARALRLGQPTGRQYATPGGALFGGIGDVIGAVRGAKAYDETQAKIDALGARRRAAVEQATQPAADPFVGQPGPMTEDEQARIMAEALSGREQKANALLASGYAPLVDMGRNELGTVRTERERLAEAPAKRLREALDRTRLQGQEAELGEANAPAHQAFHDLAAKFGQKLPPGMTNRQAEKAVTLMERAYAAEQQAEDRRLGREAMRGERKARADEKTEKDLDKQIETLSKRTESAPAMRNDLRELEAGPEEDIPGVGPIAGRLPMWMLSEDGKRKRQAARGLVGTIIKERSGTAASEKEIDRIMEETGLNMANEEQFRLGVDRLRQQVTDVLKAKEAGARPEAVQEARRRGLVTSRDIAPGPAAGQPPPVPDGKVRMMNPAGQIVDVPAAQVDAALSRKWKRAP